MSESAEGGSLLGTIKLYTGGGGGIASGSGSKEGPPPPLLPTPPAQSPAE